MAIVQSSQAHKVSGHRHDLRRVEWIVAGIQRVNAFLFVVLGLALVGLLAIRGPGRFSFGQWLCIGVTFETIVLTYVGLRLRKPWVVSLMVFGSAYTMIPCAAGRPDTLVTVIALGLGRFLRSINCGSSPVRTQRSFSAQMG
jgi:hypothetical protein